TRIETDRTNIRDSHQYNATAVPSGQPRRTIPLIAMALKPTRCVRRPSRSNGWSHHSASDVRQPARSRVADGRPGKSGNTEPEVHPAPRRRKRRSVESNVSGRKGLKSGRRYRTRTDDPHRVKVMPHPATTSYNLG